MSFESRFDELKKLLESDLEHRVPDTVPQPLRDAMRYSLLSGGKRLRGVLLLEAYALKKDDPTPALPFAAALEMIHAYSLIHDDLPAMDNDTLRRGKPTNHVVFGEAVAILAGDGLLSLAFETMLHSGLDNALRAAAEIASRAGVCGMVGGQTVDVTREGETPNAATVSYIHTHKTADLLTAPLTAGLMLASANEQEIDVGRTYGQKLGLAFQIVDDLLDLKSTPEMLGKSIGKDVAEGKLTWPALYGTAQSEQDAARLIQEACDAAACFGNKAEFLQALALNTLHRVK